MATRKKVTKKKVTKKKVPKKPATKKKTVASTKFYHFRQNNSYGRFDYDEKRGISVNVIVEAVNADDANLRAERIGLYFGGDGDCPCCGNRWSEQYEYRGKDNSTEFPSVYGDKVAPGEAFPKNENAFRWTSDKQFDGFIHYKNGTIAGFWK